MNYVLRFKLENSFIHLKREDIYLFSAKYIFIYINISIYPTPPHI